MSPFLFDVPADRPSRERRLHLFCREHGIACHDSQFEGDQARWVAIHLETCRSIPYVKNKQGDVFDCFADAGRIIDDADLAGYGSTKEDAVFELCKRYKINTHDYQ